MLQDVAQKTTPPKRRKGPMKSPNKSAHYHSNLIIAQINFSNYPSFSFWELRADLWQNRDGSGENGNDESPRAAV